MAYNSKTNSIIMAFKLVCISRKLLKKKEFDKDKIPKKNPPNHNITISFLSISHQFHEKTTISKFHRSQIL